MLGAPLAAAASSGDFTLREETVLLVSTEAVRRGPEVNPSKESRGPRPACPLSLSQRGSKDPCFLMIPWQGSGLMSLR